MSANTNYVIRALLPGSGVFSPRKRAEVCRGVPAAWGAEGGAGGAAEWMPAFPAGWNGPSGKHDELLSVGVVTDARTVR